MKGFKFHDFEKGFKILDPSKNGADMGGLVNYDKINQKKVVFNFNALYDKYGSVIGSHCKYTSNEKIVLNDSKPDDNEAASKSVFDELEENKNFGKKMTYNIEVSIGNFYDEEGNLKNQLLPENNMVDSFSDVIHGISKALQYDFFIEFNKSSIYNSLHVLYFDAIFRNIYSKLQYNLINHFEEKVIRDGIETCLTRLIIDRDAQRWFSDITKNLITKYISSKRFNVVVSNFTISPENGVDYTKTEENTKIYCKYNIKRGSKYDISNEKFIIPFSNNLLAEIKLDPMTIVTGVQHLLFHTMIAIIVRRLIIELTYTPNPVEKGIISDIIRHYSFAASSISDIYSSQEKLCIVGWDSIRQFVLNEFDALNGLVKVDPKKNLETRVEDSMINLFTFINNANSIEGIDGLNSKEYSMYFQQMYTSFKVLVIRMKEFVLTIHNEVNSLDDIERSRLISWMRKVCEYKFESLFNNGMPISTYDHTYYLEFDYEEAMKTGKLVLFNEKNEPINNANKFDPPILWRTSQRFDLKFIYLLADVISQIIKISENCVDWMNMLKDKIESMYAKDLDIKNNIIGLKYFTEGRGTFSPKFITPDSVLFDNFRSYPINEFTNLILDHKTKNECGDGVIQIAKFPIMQVID